MSAKCSPGREGNQLPLTPTPDSDLLLAPAQVATVITGQAAAQHDRVPKRPHCQWRGPLVGKVRCAGFGEAAFPCLGQDLSFPVVTRSGIFRRSPLTFFNDGLELVPTGLGGLRGQGQSNLSHLCASLHLACNGEHLIYFLYEINQSWK